LKYILIAADLKDAISLNGHRLLNGEFAINRDDFAMVENYIRFFRARRSG
jgi:hypothetical protein